jgi:hypothetical protein
MPRDVKIKLIIPVETHSLGAPSAIFETENKQLTSSEFILNPGHKPGLLPNFLNGKGVKVIVSRGMVGGAVDNSMIKGLKWS